MIRITNTVLDFEVSDTIDPIITVHIAKVTDIPNISNIVDIVYSADIVDF